jgi:hypothetical protein
MAVEEEEQQQQQQQQQEKQHEIDSARSSRRHPSENRETWRRRFSRVGLC